LRSPVRSFPRPVATVGLAAPLGFTPCFTPDWPGVSHACGGREQASDTSLSFMPLDRGDLVSHPESPQYNAVLGGCSLAGPSAEAIAGLIATDGGRSWKMTKGPDV
jgi:hypothetical protein